MYMSNDKIEKYSPELLGYINQILNKSWSLGEENTSVSKLKQFS